MVYSATLKLSQLKLDQENYRVGHTSNQRETLKAIIDEQKNKLANHAADLVKVGISPGEFVWVIPDPKEREMFIVLEGNRRVASLKILDSPALADGTIVEKQFRALARQYENPIREVQAIVFGDRLEARPWIRRRHMSPGSGVGLQQWKPAAKGRAMRDEGDAAPRFLAVLEFLADGSDAWAEIEAALDDRWTTVDRVLNSSSLPKILGVTIHPRTGKIEFENGNVQAGRALLFRMLSVMAAPNFQFASIEKARDREDFVKGFSDWSVKATPDTRKDDGDARGDKDDRKGGADRGAASGAKRGRAKMDSVARDTLAPKSGARMLHVDGTRLNPLYRECRTIKVSGYENAAAFLLRVFIELSSEALLVAKNVPLPNRLQKEGKQHWSDIGIPLATKVGCVIDCLDPTKKAKQFQQARLAAQPTARSGYSIHTLHGYFHNLKLIPDAAELKQAWDSWEAYLHEVHNALSPAP